MNQRPFFLPLIFISTLLVGQVNSSYAQQQPGKIRVQGQVLDSKTGKALPFSGIQLEELSTSFATDESGTFTTPALSPGSYTFRFRSLGYETKDTTLRITPSSTMLRIALDPSSLTLDEVSVYAKFKQGGSDVTIDQSALAYIQPTSLRDIFQLLPGGLSEVTSLQDFRLISSRQAGSESATSFGMAIIEDGIPVNNDANRLQVSGLMDASANGSFHMPVNAGVDLRSFSADHIQTVRVVRGISSAKYGNLSSGAIEISSKRGASPLTARGMLDSYNKLLYVGKGFDLGGKKGTLHTGIDYTHARKDILSDYSSYKRVTSQAMYNNRFQLAGKDLDFDFKYGFTFSLNNTKDDPLVTARDEYFKSTYRRHALMSKAKLYLNSPWIDNLTASLSLDRSDDLIKARAFVKRMGGVTITPDFSPGEHYADILPSEYHSNYQNENKPLTLYYKIDGETLNKSIGKLRNNLFYGVDYSYSKNKGQGAIYEDLTRPPYPDSYESRRPFPNNRIPYLSTLSGYIEDNMVFTMPKDAISLTAGLRFTKPQNLPDYYKLSSRVLTDPRVNLTYKHYEKLANGGTLENAFWVGFGRESKMPSLDYLYPDFTYIDYVVRQAATNDDKIMTHTFVTDNKNPDIKENRNRKIEVGWSINTPGFEFFISVFDEHLKDAMDYFKRYRPIQYTKYNTTDISKTELINEFASYYLPVNSASTKKKGFEYRMRIPNIRAIRSDIEINGAYYRTEYGWGTPVWDRPTTIVNNELIPYIGMYENGSDAQIYSRFNTNIMVNTHLAKHGLILTNMVQFLWFNKMRYDNNFSPIPNSYMDLNGDIYPYSDEIVQQKLTTDPLLGQLSSLQNNKNYILGGKEPVAIKFDLKASKELFNRKLVASFFVKGMIDLAQKFKMDQNLNTRNVDKPYFGAELRFHL